MNRVSQTVMKAWVGLGPRFLPFADAATPDLPLSRLLRLSLIQVSVGMSLVLLIGTLNRVMIVELGVPASLVGVMISLPLIFAPFRALIGFRSDTHQSVLGWRRVPFIYRGTMVQFGGLAIMPFALLVLSGGGNSASAPVWLGQLAAGLAFLLVGVGLHTTQTVGLALATDLASTESQPKVVGLMYSMLLFGTIASALLFGALLANFTPGRLIQVIQGAAVATIVLNGVALWKQETRNRSPLTPVNQRQPSFQESWESFIHGGRAMRRLVAVGLGTMAFSMEDVLLEPYGGQILHLTVGDTTKLTATLAAGGLLGFGLASRVLSRGADPFRMASYGALVGIPAFAAVIASAPLSVPLFFGLGTLLIGFGCGLFGHGTLTATMNLAPRNQTGLALGAWGAVQASAAGSAIALGGIIRDVVGQIAPPTPVGSAAGYDLVYAIEIVLLFVTLVTMVPLLRGRTMAPQRNSQLMEGRPAEALHRKGRSMTQTISRMFASHEQATGAVAALKENAYEYVFLVSRPEATGADATGASRDSIVAAIMKSYVLKAHAEIYAEGVSRGGSLVTVHAPWGTAVNAIAIMDRYDPIDSGITETRTPLRPWDEAAPLSSALQMPVLLDDKATYSGFWNVLPLLTERGSYCSWFGLPLLANGGATVSESLGLPLISDNPAPLSSLFHFPVLTKERPSRD
jgi:BCD family chlorophyll transporter-like MFS transporter